MGFPFRCGRRPPGDAFAEVADLALMNELNRHYGSVTKSQSTTSVTSCNSGSARFASGGAANLVGHYMTTGDVRIAAYSARLRCSWGTAGRKRTLVRGRRVRGRWPGLSARTRTDLFGDRVRCWPACPLHGASGRI
jgi:hypothetical protein